MPHAANLFNLLYETCRVAELYEYAMLPEHMWSPDESVGPNSITETGALCISSGAKTGRVPKQKRIVEDELTKDVSTSFKPAAAVNYRLQPLNSTFVILSKAELDLTP